MSRKRWRGPSWRWGILTCHRRWRKVEPTGIRPGMWCRCHRNWMWLLRGRFCRMLHLRSNLTNTADTAVAHIQLGTTHEKVSLDFLFIDRERVGVGPGFFG